MEFVSKRRKGKCGIFAALLAYLVTTPGFPEGAGTPTQHYVRYPWSH